MNKFQEIEAVALTEPPSKINVSVIDLFKVGLIKSPAMCGFNFTLKIVSWADQWGKLKQKLVGNQQHWVLHLAAVKPNLQKKGLGELAPANP